MFPQTTYSAYLVDSTGKNDPQPLSHYPVDAIDPAKIWAAGVKAFNACRDAGKWDKLVMFESEPMVAREAFL